jgi:UDP-N-acetylmuramyl pentapeptide phosphotransferase/UDP-N-acetylglucosamine-1-phosphate transferase
MPLWFPPVVPDARSNHKTPTPSGAGAGIMLIISGGLVGGYAGYYSLPDFFSHPSVIASIIVLTLVSFVDDVKNLPVKLRLITQALCLAIIYPVFAEYFSALEYIPIAFGLLVFMNLCNFMDGIDGMAATETISIAIGSAAIAYIVVGGMAYPYIHACIIVGAPVAGFLIYNWHPARIFMGDSGSVPLGLLTGILLVIIANAEELQAALLLPAYYLVDSLTTITRRLLDGEKIWQAHSRHFYQLAVRSGRSHSWVVLRISAINIMLILLAVATLYSDEFWGWIIVCVGYIFSAALCYFFWRLWYSSKLQENKQIVAET